MMKFLLAVAVIALAGLVVLLALSIVKLKREDAMQKAKALAGDLRNRYYPLEDLLATADWLGKTREETGIPAECMEEHIYLKAGVIGNLFGQDAYGSVYFTDPKESEERRVEKIHLYTGKLTFPAMKEYLKAVYEEPVSDGEEPYVEVNGGAIQFAVFEAETGYRVRLTKGSIRSYVELTIE